MKSYIIASFVTVSMLTLWAASPLAISTAAVLRAIGGAQ